MRVKPLILIRVSSCIRGKVSWESSQNILHEAISAILMICHSVDGWERVRLPRRPDEIGIPGNSKSGGLHLSPSRTRYGIQCSFTYSL
jgi:hypothetical protein